MSAQKRQNLSGSKVAPRVRWMCHFILLLEDKKNKSVFCVCAKPPSPAAAEA